jgi:hypothetical protein
MFNTTGLVALLFDATPIFLNVTIAHDKGKPVARQGRKAVNLQAEGCSRFVHPKFGRLSGYRRRSEKFKTPSTRRPPGRFACAKWTDTNPTTGYLQLAPYQFGRFSGSTSIIGLLRVHWFHLFHRTLSILQSRLPLNLGYQSRKGAAHHSLPLVGVSLPECNRSLFQVSHSGP